MKGSGLCHCGCGEKTLLAKQGDTKRGLRKGDPQRFINGHNRLNPNDYSLPQGTVRGCGGYLLTMRPEHPRASFHGYVQAHRLVVEEALGRFLPEGAEPHHVNGFKDDNRPINLVICQDRAYHFLLHQRQRAKERCGNPDWRPCYICHEYDAPENMSPHRNNFYHKSCAAQRARERKGFS